MRTATFTTSITSMLTIFPGMAANRIHTRMFMRRSPIRTTTFRICITGIGIDIAIEQSAAAGNGGNSGK